MFSFVPPAYYTLVFSIVAWSFCILLSCFYLQSPDNRKLLTPVNKWPVIAFTILVILYIGLRPEGHWFGDSYYYIHTYNTIVGTTFESNLRGEWFSWNLMTFCKQRGWSHHAFFLIDDFIYIASMLFVCRKLLWENMWMAMLFFFSSFSFFTYGVNGLRQGMATSLILIAISLMASRKKVQLLIALFFMFLATGAHHSTLISVGMLLVAYYIVKKPKWAIICWLLSIVISLPLGSYFESLLFSLSTNVEDRYIGYSEYGSTASLFSHTGFRWDFLLYSSIPVILGYFICILKKHNDRIYNFIFCSYTLINAVWILICRMPYNNRLAYLSWSIYPLVLAYPMIRMHIWEDQDRRAGYFLLGHTAFTMFLELFVWGTIFK